MIFAAYQEFLAPHLLPMLAVCIAVMAHLEYVNHIAAYLGILVMAFAHCYLSGPVNSHQQVND